MNRQFTMLLGMIAFFVFGTTVVAQENTNVNFRMEARGDYQYENVARQMIPVNTGFRGKQFNLRLNGNITEAISYTYRQRMGRSNVDASYFDAIDHLNLTYTTGSWAFTGGKQTVVVGGYEYDRAPIDFYFGSEYWYNMACYQWGVSAMYTFGDDASDALKLQLSQSPFGRDLYGYSLMWIGSHGCLDVLHSVNMMEYFPGKYVNFIAFGHQFRIGRMTLQLDYMNRADMANFTFSKDFSVMADLSWAALKNLNVFGKVTYDLNEDNTADLCVLPGTELVRVGGGVEYFPLEQNHDVRLHANYSYAWGQNGNTNGTVFDNQSFLSVGLTWKMSILNR